MFNLKKAVIIGAGFGGVVTAINLLNNLKKSEINITLISNRDYFTFVPLIHEVAAGYLEKKDVTISLSKIFKNVKNLEIIIDKATKIDLDKNIVECGDLIMGFDYLVVSSGSTTNFFNTKGAKENCFELKNIEDAYKIREKINSLMNNEANITIIGAGATGVEIAAEIACIIKDKKSKAKVQIIHGGQRVLPALDIRLSSKAAQRLNELGVKIFLNSRVKKVNKGRVLVNEDTNIKSDMTIWAAGIKASPIPVFPGVAYERGCLAASTKLSLLSHKKVFAIGDAAYCRDKSNDKPVPFLAQAAIGEAKTAAKNIELDIKNKEQIDFNFKFKGVLVSLGRWCAVGTPLSMNMSGKIPWMMKKILYRTYILFLKNSRFFKI